MVIISVPRFPATYYIFILVKQYYTAYTCITFGKIHKSYRRPQVLS